MYEYANVCQDAQCSPAATMNHAFRDDSRANHSCNSSNNNNNNNSVNSYDSRRSFVLFFETEA